jgi:hypothetical protein
MAFLVHRRLRKGQFGIRRSDMTNDEELQKRVLDELRWEPKVQSNEVGVIAKDGAVTLTGEVHTYAEKLAAERAAKRVKGVRAVAADIRVKIPSRLATSDAIDTRQFPGYRARDQAGIASPCERGSVPCAGLCGEWDSHSRRHSESAVRARND